MQWPTGPFATLLWLGAVAAWIGWLLTQHVYWAAGVSLLIYGAGAIAALRR
jgi:hypothetical protein